MNKLRDTDLREALRRCEAKRPQVEVPDDFLERVMLDVEAEGQHAQSRTLRRTGRIALTLLAVAASVALLVLLTWPRQVEHDFTESKVRVSSEGSPTFLPVKSEAPVVQIKQGGKAVSTGARVEANEARGTRPSRPRVVTVDPRTSSAANKIDSLDYYIAQIERELTQVDESLYIERMRRVMLADERLQRLVNNYILHEFHKDNRPHEAAIINVTIEEQYDEE